MTDSAKQILILKTGALGDVLRTTSILPGLARRDPGCRVSWVTAHGARPLIERHPDIAAVVGVDPKDAESVARAGDELAATRWSRVLSFDDEEPLCRLASRLGGAGEGSGVVSGAYLASAAAEDGSSDARVYSPDVAPWFDMGLLSVHGKREADRLKLANERSHPAIFADMLGVEMGELELPLGPEAEEFGRAFAARRGAPEGVRWIGLNTGAGGRWESKRLSEERVAELVRELDRRSLDGLGYVLLGGHDELERNARILARLAGHPRLVDAGTRNGLLEFAAIVDGLDLLVTSDSLALHVANARRVPIVAFFAPTSAAEIELYGRGEHVISTAPDYCSYRSDADTSSLTPERIAAAVERVLEQQAAR